MNERQLKKAFKQMARMPGGRDQLRAMLQEKDTKAFDAWAETPNGSARLQMIYQAVDDTSDTLLAVGHALVDRDYNEARKLVALGIDSLHEHVTILKGLL
jgi:hypothetical protein